MRHNGDWKSDFAIGVESPVEAGAGSLDPLDHPMQILGVSDVVYFSR